jgi:epoxyqueuosine reductase
MLSADLVKKKAIETGFDLVGITDAKPMRELTTLLEERQLQGKEPEFVSDSIEKRLEPKFFFPKAKSIVMTAVNYYYSAACNESFRSKLSRSAWGLDYHRVMGGMLEQLGQSLQELEPELQYKTFVDTGPLVERELARRAGLGWIGKNAALITPQFGSWVFLGGMAVNLEFEEDKPLDRSCGNCRQCIEACPAGALEDAYCVNPNRCLSYVSQKKGYLTAKERELLKDRLYGCDTCQQVCPINMELAKNTTVNALKPLRHSAMSLAEAAGMGNKQFKALLGSTAAAWRGKTNIALGNSGDLQTVPFLKKALGDPSPIIRGHAVWALGRMAGRQTEVIKVLMQALDNETDPQVKQEIAGVLKNISRT